MESTEILELIRKAKAGDNEATETLIEKYLNAVRKINNKCFIVNCFCAKISEYYNIYNRYTDKIVGNDFVFHILDKHFIYSFLI